jgi:hypothetical protein
MTTSVRDRLALIEPDAKFIVHAPDGENHAGNCSYLLIWAAHLHHEKVFHLPDGGFQQANIAFLHHPTTCATHAFIIASHEDHEGCWQEFVSCDELLDCRNWDSFLDILYGYRLDSGLDLSVTNRDAFLQLMPEWIHLFV